MKKALPILFSLVIYCSVSGQGTLVDFNTIPKSGTILVLSHMDDDVIWMLPWWKIVEKFIGGAMPSASRFVTVVDQQQAYLDANGYNIDYKSNWIMPWGTITMKEYSDYYWDNLPSAQYLAADHLIAYWDNSDLPLVRAEINRIKAKLEQYIADPSVSRIVTHNNWGEYGHQHHKAVNKAVRELAVKYKKDVWMLGCNNGDFVDINVPNGVTYTMASFNDPTLFTSIRTIYKNNWCWTWPDNIPSGDHKFIKVVDGGTDKSALLTGESVAVTGPSQYEPGAYIFDGNDDFMTMWGNKTSAFSIAMRIMPDLIRSMDISSMSEYPGSETSDRNLFMNSNGTISARIFDGSSKVVTSSTPLTDNTWSEIVMVGDGSSVRIYINGSLEGSVPAGSAITSYVSPELVIGQPNMTSAFFSGQISDVRIYDRALTDNEIAALSGARHIITASGELEGTIAPSGQVSVLEGSNQTFNISGNPGYRVSDVIADGTSVGAVSSYTFSNVASNHTIHASFVPGPTHTISATAGSGGSVTPSGNTVVNEGTRQQFTITPGQGYSIRDVIVDDASVGAVSSYSFINVTADHKISASFAPLTYTITGSAGTGGSLSPSGITYVNYGSGRTYTITPNTGFAVSNVIVDNVSVGAMTSYTFSDVRANHTISATFSQLSFQITASAGTGGTLNPSGTTSLNYGSGLTYSIVPAAGYSISNVLVDNRSVGAVTSYTFVNVTSGHSISATFIRNTYLISVTGSTGGTITPSGNQTVTYGTSQSFTITADYGYQIGDVLVDNVSAGAVTSYTFSNITSGHSISATFTHKKYTLSSSAGDGGSISPAGQLSLDHGSSQTYSIAPDEGYGISDVKVDGITVGAVSEYTFSSLTESHTISATFSVLNYTLTSSAGSGGTISPEGVTSVEYGSNQEFVITPDEGYIVADVKLDDVSVGAVDKYTITDITSNRSLTASFEPKTFHIAVNNSINGIITPGGDTEVTYGSSKSFTITPASGYKITDVKIDNISVGAVSSYVIENIKADHCISAEFGRINLYTINSNAGKGGSIYPYGTISIQEDASQTFEINPVAGYRIVRVTVDNHDVGNVSNYTFDTIKENHSITAEFSSETSVTAYPSPFRDEFSVRIDTPLEDKFDLYVYDIASRIVYLQKEVQGNSVTTINLETSPGGVYIVRLYHDSVVVATIKVIKLK